MSRDLTAAHKTAITGDTVTPVILVVLEFDSGTLRFWNGVGDFVYNSNTYTGTGNLLRVSEITETQKLEARGLSFELSGMPSSIISIALSEDYQDRPISMLFAPLDATGAAIADPYTYFKGKADVMAIDEGAETATITMTAESDLISLNRPSERRRTPEDHKIDYSADTFFDTVAALQDLQIVWGR
jgi:hypothetical protein